MRLFRRWTVFMLAVLLLAGAAQIPALASGYATLRTGDSGAEVQRMQAALIAQKYLSGAADGKFGANTYEAVRRFQQANGLAVDGLAGNRTLTILYAAAGTGGGAAPRASGTLEYGSSGSAVVSLQKALTQLGFNTGGADGKFGANTQKAVEAFQRANGLAADGKAGPATLAKLDALAGSGGTGSGSAPGTPSATLSRTLRSGATGEDVRLLQTKLAALDYSVTVNGKYDSKTVAAVKAFQGRNRLTADGVAGPNTFKALLSSNPVRAGGDTGAATPPAVYTTLRSGASGAAVKALQQQLASLGYKVTATGKFDAQTVQGVKSFQSLNRLTVDGIAGVKTQTLAYSGKAVQYSAQGANTNVYNAPSVGQVKLLHWYDDVKPALRGKSSIYVHDPATGNGFTLKLYSLGAHADVEPMTAADTASMMDAFGGKITWTPKFVFVRLPSGAWTAATMHNVAHGGQSITDNDFKGQNCVHFLRDMDEAIKNDPDYGVTNQKALRKGWLNLTGEAVD
ncbi:MAG TPA: peptidoglycan-binding protein [Candidatus Limnocylindria bacterium]|nr:peptidoglycan-binding protein [Candidatus Limnocylindria bacterium]